MTEPRDQSGNPHATTSSPDPADAGRATATQARPTHGPKRKGRAPRRHTIGTVVLASALVLGLVTGLGVVYLYRHLNGNITVSQAFNDVDNRPDKIDTGPGEPLRVLVLGSDTRDGEGNKIDGESGGGVSDTTILLHLSADRERAYGISIPRDSLVTRPSCGPDDEITGGERQMWNAAFALGGEACTIEQFEQNTGVRVDDFVVIDFAGFKNMVDALDGVPVCIPEDIDDPDHNIFIPAGERQIRGNEALNYVRVRSGIGDGSDLGRIKRQQAFIAAMVNKVVSAGTLARPDRLVGFPNAATKSLTTSPGLDNVTQLGKLGYSVQSIGLDKVQFVTVPWEYDAIDPNRVSWLPEADRLWRLIKMDKPLPKRFTEDAISADKAPGSGNKGPGNGTSSPSPSQSTSPSPDGTDTDETREADEAGLCA